MENERKFRLVDDEEVYTFEEIAQKIRDAQLSKFSYIWEPSLPDWTTLDKYSAFQEVFKERERLAQEALAKAMGTDKESLERKEMQQFLSEVEQEKQHLAFAHTPWLRWIVTMFACVAMVASALRFLHTLFYTKEGQELLGTVIEEPVETLDIERVRMASGVTRLDEVKGIAVKKVEKKREKDLLAEILAEMKAEEAAEKKAVTGTLATSATAVSPAATARSVNLFDKVSDEEVEQFRRSLLAKTGYSGSKSTVVKDNTTMAAIPEELSAKQVAAVVKEHSGSTIAYCYNKSLKLDTSLSGKLEVTVSVLGNGRVAKVETNTPKFRGTNLERCVKDMIKKKWVFPEFNGAVTEVTIPFVLSSE